jgi:hypothetical protein
MTKVQVRYSQMQPRGRVAYAAGSDRARIESCWSWAEMG